MIEDKLKEDLKRVQIRVNNVKYKQIILERILPCVYVNNCNNYVLTNYCYTCNDYKNKK